MKKLKEYLKNENNIHIWLIILGTLFLILPIFHQNMWFDESYTVAICKHPFNEIWTIGSHDVHPVLYYFIVRIIFMLTNNSIIAARFFSAVPLVILAILGYTHISKDFGRKTGMIFSTLILIFPSVLMYAGELRMYTWAALFVSIMCLYAYRIIKYDYSKKNWAIFAIFSLASAYTHYYALIIAAIVNICLLIYFIIKNVKAKKEDEKKYFKKQIITLLIQAVIEVILYLPWLGALLAQTKSVSGGFWITTPNPLQVMIFLATGSLDDKNFVINKIFSCFITATLVYLFIHNWKDKETMQAKLSFALLVGLQSLILLIGKIIGQNLLYQRYLFTLIGVLIFAGSLLLSKEGKKVEIVTLSIIMCFSLYKNINLINENYDKSNNEPYNYLKENYEDGDIVIVANSGSGFVLMSRLENKNNYKNMYFYDLEHWGVEEAYKAFGKTMEDLDSLKDYKGRIWIISNTSVDLASRVQEELGRTKVIKENKTFDTKYKNYSFAIELLEKE